MTEKAENPSAAQASSVLPPSSIPLNLLLDKPLADSRTQWRRILAGSILLHVVFFVSAIRLPSFIRLQEPARRVVVRRVPLYFVPDILTQRAPNQRKISKTIDLADVRPTRRAQPEEARSAASRKQFEIAKQAAPQQTAKATPRILAEAPKIAVNQPGSLPGGVANGLPPAVGPPVEPGPFQNVGSEAPLNPHPTLIPKAGVQAAIEALAQNAKESQTAVSDESSSERSPRLPGSVGQPASLHAAVELESDRQGVDFKPYLMRILAIVRANWRRVVPESARMGTLRGRTVMEFIINRDGSIPKIVTADSSGSDPLDRAALAGLSMSNPLPPLPADYKGFQVRLAFTFTYNLSTQ